MTSSEQARLLDGGAESAASHSRIIITIGGYRIRATTLSAVIRASSRRLRRWGRLTPQQRANRRACRTAPAIYTAPGGPRPWFGASKQGEHLRWRSNR